MKTGFAYTIGRRHAAEQDPDLRLCQDLAGSYSDETVTIIAVADGKAGRYMPQAAVAAARANISTIIDFFRDPATWRIAEKNDFKNTALRMLDSALEAAAGSEGFRYEELRATISAVAVRSNGEFLALSVGDGTVVALDQELNPSVLIPPYREGQRGKTVYTNDPDGADAHISVWGGTVTQSNFLAFAVFTDGADYLTRHMADGTNVLRTAAACTLFGSGSEYIEQEITEIAKEHSKDDVALAVLSIETENAFAIAKNVVIEARAAKAAQEAAAAEEVDGDTTTEEELPAPPMPEEEVDPNADAEETASEESAQENAEDGTEESAEPAAEDVTEEPTEEISEEITEEEPAPEPEPEPVNTDPTPAEVLVLRAVFARPLTADELVSEGIIRKGRILETVLPLIRAGRIRYENGRFAGNE